MRELKAINENLNEVDQELGSLIIRRAEIEGKIAGLQNVPENIPASELSSISESNSEFIQEHKAKIKHIEAAGARLQERKKQLQAELHEAEGAAAVKTYISNVKTIYKLCVKNNELTTELMKLRREISELAGSVGLSQFEDTAAYEESKKFPVPSLPLNLGQIDIQGEHGWTLQIPLSEAMLGAIEPKS